MRPNVFLPGIQFPAGSPAANPTTVGPDIIGSGVNRRVLRVPSMRWVSCFLLLLFLSGAVSVFSQSVREISTRDGLPQSFVSGLVQDDSSFIWIGTRNGIARYDGVQFRVFQHDPHDTTTLASNIIIWMKKDAQNRLWIEYETSEIDQMDPATEKIQHFLKGNLPTGEGVQFIRRGWLVDKTGIFWGIVRGGGLNNYDRRTGKIEHFNRSDGFPSDTVRGLNESSTGGIWALGERTIGLFDQKTKQFVQWQLPFKQDYGNFPESDAVAIDLHERKNGELMWGDRQRLFFFNPVTHTFRTVPLPVHAFLGVRSIRTGGDGFDYLETFGKVFRYSDESGVTSIGETITDNFGDVKSFLVDHSGLIWMGTNAGGIHLIDLDVPFFKSFKYKTDFFSDLLQQEMGINMRQLFGWAQKDQGFSSPGYHFRSVYDVNRRLYLALKETVCYYDGRQKKYIKLPHVPVLGGPNESGIFIKGVTIGPNGAPMVVGYNGNVLFYDSTRKDWRQFIDPALIRKTFGNNTTPQDVLADDRNIWITTGGDGLLKIDIHTREVRQLKEDPAFGSLPTNELLGLHADPFRPDLLWIGSYQGLICLNKQTLKCELFSLKEGLPDNTVYGILADHSGNLWLTTNKGICMFDPRTHVTRVFNTRHGLPGDEFNRFHQLELPDGKLAFGGTEGWTIFDPRLMKNDDYQPVVAFTEIRINNKDETVSGPNRILRLPLNATEQLDLPYEKNTVSVSFAGLEFSQPQDIRYRYRLDGYDNDWVVSGRTHRANYTKIPPGNYTLYVNASNTTGKWSSHINAFKIRIHSPWWSTPMAYLCYCIIVAGLTWTFIRLRVARIVMKREMELKEKEATQMKELDDMKSRFFSNITHEFRTPLTLILGPAEQLKSAETLDPQQSSKLAGTIVNNAKQLLILINRLMDLSKLEAKALKLHEQRGNPASMVGSVVHSFESDAQARRIQLSFENQTGGEDCWFFADAMERIVYNLVSNSLRFTQPGGNVKVSLSEEERTLLLKVADTGTGIPKDKLPYIFDRFYQADEHSDLANEDQHEGTGIGLSMVKELVSQMNGKIEVESSIPSAGISSAGTVFTISLPRRPVKSDQADSSVAGDAEQDVSRQADKYTAGRSDGETEAQSDPAENDAGMAQILLVEDSEELAEYITGILSDQYRVIHAANGALGLDQALSVMPDLILSDVMMPVMDGYEFCGRVKEDIRTSHIPVVLLTAKVSQENVIEGLTKGADDYLTKPFHPTELLLRIHNLLDRQQKLRERFRQDLVLPLPADSMVKQQPIQPIIQDIFVTKLYELLDEHLDDSLFGVDQLAGFMNISRSSLHRKLKNMTGMSTTEVVRNYRLKKATVFLREGFNSSDTAYKAGFGSPAYFTKSFREVYGITPGEYTRQSKN